MQPGVITAKFAAAVAALPCGVHIPRHQPPVEHGNQAALILKFQSQALNHLHIATVTIEEDKFSCAVTVQAQENLTAELIENLVVNVNRSGVRGQTLAGAVGDGRSNQNVALLLDLFQQKIRNQGIGSKRHVTTMALNAADGDEHHVVLFKILLCLRPGQICKSHIFYFLFIHNFEQKSELSGGRIARHPSITGQP